MYATVTLASLLVTDLAAPSLYRPAASIVDVVTGRLFSANVIRNTGQLIEYYCVVRAYQHHGQLLAGSRTRSIEYTRSNKPENLKELEHILAIMYQHRAKSFVKPLALMSDFRCTILPEFEDLQGMLVNPLGISDFPFRRVIAEYSVDSVPSFIQICVEMIQSYPNSNAAGSVIWSFRDREDMLLSTKECIDSIHRMTKPDDGKMLSVIRQLTVELESANWHRVRNDSIVKYCTSILKVIPLQPKNAPPVTVKPTPTKP